MIQKLTSILLPLTRELVQEFLNMQPVEGERPLKPRRLKVFRVHLRNGTFNSPTWAKTFVGDTDELYRADGQHTSRALADCDDSLFPKDQSVTINTYRITSKDDLAALFDIFDNPESARTNAEKLGTYIADYPEFKGLDRECLNHIAHGVDYYCRDLVELGQPTEIFAQRQHGLYYRNPVHRSFALWLYLLREAKHGWMIRKPGIAAEMFADWSNHRELAERFWGEVMTESNPDVEDETRELATTLRDWTKKQPRVKQEKFRAHSKKIFDRYRRAHTIPHAIPQAESPAPSAPPETPQTPLAGDVAA